MRRTLILLALAAAVLALHWRLPFIAMRDEHWPVPGGGQVHVTWFGEGTTNEVSLLIPGRGAGNRSMRWLAEGRGNTCHTNDRVVAIDFVSADVSTEQAADMVYRIHRDQLRIGSRISSVYGVSDGAWYLPAIKNRLDERVCISALGVFVPNGPNDPTRPKIMSYIGRFDELVEHSENCYIFKEFHDHFTVTLVYETIFGGSGCSCEDDASSVHPKHRLITPFLIVLILFAAARTLPRMLYLLSILLSLPANLWLFSIAPPVEFSFGNLFELFFQFPLLLTNRLMDKLCETIVAHPLATGIALGSYLVALNNESAVRRRFARFRRASKVSFLAVETDRLALLAVLAAVAVALWCRQAESAADLAALLELQFRVFRRLLLLPAIVGFGGLVWRRRAGR